MDNPRFLPTSNASGKRSSWRLRYKFENDNGGARAPKAPPLATPLQVQMKPRVAAVALHRLLSYLSPTFAPAKAGSALS